MKRRHVRPAFRCLLTGIALLGVAWFALPPIMQPRQRRAVEAVLARFEAGPSREGVNELVQLLDSRRLTAAQGERILKMLLYPNVITRPAYPLGKSPTCSLERPFRVRFAHAMASSQTEIWADGKRLNGSGGRGGASFDTTPVLYSLSSEPHGPGLYDEEIRHEYEIDYMPAKTTWSWNPGRGRLPRSLLPRKRTSYTQGTDVSYRCDFTVPIQFRVVEEDEAETIALLSDPELDERMRRTFAVSSRHRSSGTYHTLAGKRSYASSNNWIEFDILPSAVSFKAALRLANGDEIPARGKYPTQYQRRANMSGELQVVLQNLLLEEPGDYRATLILTPDPDNAYRDPVIKAIWGGTLEFPVHFTIGPEPDAE